MLAKQARKIQASECGANMLLLAARRTVVGSASVMLPASFSGPEPGHHDMILGLAWMHTHLEGRGGHGTHGGFRERSERFQRQILGGC